MDVIIAILWYLNLLMPQTYYSNDDVTNMINANAPTINTIYADEPLTNHIVADYYDPNNNHTHVIQPWDDSDELPPVIIK